MGLNLILPKKRMKKQKRVNLISAANRNRQSDNVYDILVLYFILAFWLAIGVDCAYLLRIGYMEVWRDCSYDVAFRYDEIMKKGSLLELRVDIYGPFFIIH